MSVLSVRNLTKKFPKKQSQFVAVDNISFDLKEGEILGFLGPNGAGKTTTIQMLLGVLTPTEGEIVYFGKNLADHHSEILEQVNFSSTYTDMPAKLTVWENLDYLSYLYQIKDRKKRVQRVSDIFHLNSLLRRSISELSAGQKTRVNLAKAFINFPKVLLLDEPTASLDPDVAEYIRNFLINEQKKFKTSIIFTSHNMGEVEDVCDRVIFVNHGKIIANDTPENLAKTIEICHVELIVKDGLKRTVEYCQNHGYQYKLSGRSIIVDVKEKEIAEFLRGLMDKGVYYDGISIEKPTLEDYFLKNL